jgi:hypothetical protein
MATSEIEKMFWQITTAEAASKAIGHAWVEFKKCPAGFLVQVNDKPALRFSIKYRETGPYLCVEQAPGTNETAGSCIRTAGMVQHYAAILEAHDNLGKKLHSARSFIITDEERALAKTATD